MYSLKEYPRSFTTSKSKSWLRFKRKLKKQFHVKLRRGEMTKLKVNGIEIDW